MENSNNKNILLMGITVVVVLISSVIAFLFLNKDIQLNKNLNNTEKSTNKIEDYNIIDQEKTEKSTNKIEDYNIIDQEKNVVIKSKLIDKNGEKLNYVVIEYKPDNSTESYILKTFYDNKFSLDTTSPESEQFLDKYEIAYLSNKYLAIRVTGGYEGISSDLLFDLSTLKEEKPSIDESGTYTFYDNDKYIIFKSISGISESFGGKDFITVEVVNGKSIDFLSPTSKCILTEKPTTSDITITDGVISFTEITYAEEGKEVNTEKSININDFCKDKKSE